MQPFVAALQAEHKVFQMRAHVLFANAQQAGQIPAGQRALAQVLEHGPAKGLLSLAGLGWLGGFAQGSSLYAMQGSLSDLNSSNLAEGGQGDVV